jgi:tetratricopeptide (TPR) repeat protein
MLGPADPLGLCWSPDGRALVQSGSLTPVAVWDPVSGQRLHTLRGHQETALGLGPQQALQIPAAAFSPDGQWLATGGHDGTLRLWDVHRRYRQAAVLSTMPIRIEHSLDPTSAFGRPTVPEFGLAAVGALPGFMQGFRKNMGAIRRVTFSADGSQLVVVLLNSDVRVYEMASIRDKLERPPQDLLAETERLTGLHLVGDRPVVTPQLHLVRAGQPLRKNYEQDPFDFFYRHVRIKKASEKERTREVRDELVHLLEEPGVPESVEGPVRTSLAQAHLALGEFEQAKAQLRQVLEKTPDDSRAHTTLVELHLQDRQYAQARDLLRQTLGLSGLLPEAKLAAHQRLAEVYVRMDDLSGAETEAQQAVAVPETDLPADQRWLHAWAQLSLAHVHVRQRRFSQARVLVEQVLKQEVTAPLQHQARLLLAEIDREKASEAKP